MDNFQNRRFLFSAILGQDKLKYAYLANIVNPKIGGLLISGPKGTGKSTIVHSVESILPDGQAVDGCIFNCHPEKSQDFCSLCRERPDHPAATRKMRIINLPLSCTEDRLIGSIDIEKLLKTGQKVILPGILGQANGNILYVDEVNLLPDHLVDDILDAASTHWNTIEREGISVSHPADFVLVGTMNPEEGDLRPQILDRFPLCVKIETIKDPAIRSRVVQNNLQFENDREAFHEKFAGQQEATGKQILSARELLPQVTVSPEMIDSVASSCAALKVDGQRPDIVIIKTALTLAALNGRSEVISSDILLASELTLIHRTRDGGLLEPPTTDEIMDNFHKNLPRDKEPVQKTTAKQKIQVAVPSDQQGVKKNGNP
ncbi:MAG: ATP-binding protein [Candidatus Edwardsbacteria bacterium]|nr:ATP-binding protein [Candidatus Edwardsbacteria bacterium]